MASVNTVSRPRQQQREQKVDPLDRILKGLQIAQGVFGIKTSFDKIGQIKEQETRLKQATEFDQLRSGRQESFQQEQFSEKKRATGEQEKIARERIAAGEIKAEDRLVFAQAKLAQKAVESERKITTPKKATAKEFESATFARRLELAEADFQDLKKSGFNRSDFLSGIEAFAAPESLKSSDLKRQEQAERNFVNAVLRNESGAAIAESEFESAEKQYFPRAGDGQKVIDQKRRNRQLAFEGLKAGAGTAFEQLPSLSGQSNQGILPQQPFPGRPQQNGLLPQRGINALIPGQQPAARQPSGGFDPNAFLSNP